MTARIGAVSYLNTRPLVYGLESKADLFSIRFDVPSKCAELLHGGQIDAGLIPSIEYLRKPGYRIVDGIAIASKGPVASVALFTNRPIHSVRSIALDTSSRTSVALVRVLCHERFRIEPSFVPAAPDIVAMLQQADAALIIGDIALFTDHARHGVQKIDLGEEWTKMTGLPFVYAFWAGQPDALTASHRDALKAARDAGLQRPQEIAHAYCAAQPEQIPVAANYLRENVKYYLGEEEIAGLQRFYASATALGIVPSGAQLQFY